MDECKPLPGALHHAQSPVEKHLHLGPARYCSPRHVMPLFLFAKLSTGRRPSVLVDTTRKGYGAIQLKDREFMMRWMVWQAPRDLPKRDARGGTCSC